jgi:hypothetical protein
LASAGARLTVGVTRRIHVAISRLGALSLSLIGVSKIGLSHARRESTVAYNAITWGRSFSLRFCSCSAVSRPCRSALRSN